MATEIGQSAYIMTRKETPPLYVKVLVKKADKNGAEVVHAELVPLGNLNNTLFELGQKFPKKEDEHYFIDTISLVSPAERFRP